MKRKMKIHTLYNDILRIARNSGLPEFRSFGQKGKFSPFGFRFRPPKVKAEYGQNRLLPNNAEQLLFVHENIANVNYKW